MTVDALSVSVAFRKLDWRAHMAQLGYKDTPILPDSGYHVHDPDRPQPPVVTPNDNGLPPSDAKVLFDGSGLDGWVGKDGPARWTVENGYMEVVGGSGNIKTKDTFGNALKSVIGAIDDLDQVDGLHGAEVDLGPWVLFAFRVERIVDGLAGEEPGMVYGVVPTFMVRADLEGCVFADQFTTPG